jgi:hypothetical protein
VTPSPPRLLAARAAALVLVLAAASPGCGGGKGSGPAGPDLSSPEVVHAQAMDALSRGDLEALVRVLSPAGEAQVRRDLEAWRRALLDQPRALSRLPPPRDEAEREAWKRALAGDAAELLRLYVRADPHLPEAPAPAPAARPADASWAQLDYRARDGSLRRVVLTRRGAEWRVDALQL